MHSFLDAKTMAKTLRQTLAEKNVEVSHGECLEIVARQFGYANWNVLAAKIGNATSGESLLLPADWIGLDQSQGRHYRIGLDPDEPGVALIECRLDPAKAAAPGEEDFATLMQSIRAEPYKDARIAVRADLRTVDATAASIWIRVDDASGGVLMFDNMLDHGERGALHGTTDWCERRIVSDVPAFAASIHFGVLLHGFGSVRARGFAFEVAAEDTQPTAEPGHLDRPSNLNFTASR
ncbi:glyoxalase superfamily protein [Chelativorans sp.]|uniref:glyoxalase superfamily protein n=1 Tax=Chelativorans sp. TaxID=2203393 RepID=UPI002811D8E4|nr:glyoxalase superfamily protein [Chelativorans sp.]